MIAGKRHNTIEINGSQELELHVSSDVWGWNISRVGKPNVCY